METVLFDGRMKDLSGHVNHGTMTGTTDVAGKVGRARNFDGSGDRITAPAISVPATDFTVAAWFRWTTNPSPYYSGIQGGGFSWELRIRNSGRFAVVFYQSVGPDVVTETVSPLAYNDGNWHHAAAVLRSGLVRLYADGVLVAQDTTNPIASARTSTQTIVGHVASDFAGDIDEVFVFSRALSDAEIAALASGSDFNLQFSKADSSSGVSLAFTEPSCDPAHIATLSLAAPSNRLERAYSGTIVQSTGPTSWTIWLSLMVAGTNILSLSRKNTVVPTARRMTRIHRVDREK